LSSRGLYTTQQDTHRTTKYLTTEPILTVKK
jgi:hypothetical protein